MIYIFIDNTKNMKVYLVKTNFRYVSDYRVLAKLTSKLNTICFTNKKTFSKLLNKNLSSNKSLQNFYFNKNFSDINTIKKEREDDFDIDKEINFEFNKKEELPVLKENDNITNVNLSDFYLKLKDEQLKEENSLPQQISPYTTTLEEFIPDKNLSTSQNFELYRDHMNKKEYIHKQQINYKKRVGICLFIAFIGLFSLWIPFYKVICESQGYSVKTTHQDYKFDGRKCMIKFIIYIISH